jgi:ribonucleoside-triphosphate reductase
LFDGDVLNRVYHFIRKEDKKYSKQLGVNESIKLTTVKPSGTNSLVGEVTPGIHPAYSKYYIRRVRFAAVDPLIPLLKEAGHKIEPVIKFDGNLDHETLVVDFPCMTPKGTPTADENWNTWEQLNVLKFAQKHWSDNSVSVTVYYEKEEIPKIKDWLKENLNEVKSISFLCHSDHGFKQAPYETIDKTTYDKLIASLKPLDIDSVGQAQDVDMQDCESGVCPIK